MRVEEAFDAGLLHDLDWVCGSPVPAWVTTGADRFRWLAARELCYGIATANGADPDEIARFVTVSTRSIFSSPEIRTFGDSGSLASMLEVKRVCNDREERRRARRERWRQTLRRG